MSNILIPYHHFDLASNLAGLSYLPLNMTTFDLKLSTELSKQRKNDCAQWAKSRGFRGNPRGSWLLVWVVSETRTWKFRGNFQIWVEIRGKFPQTSKHFNSPKNDIKSSLGYFHITWTLPMSLNCILKFLREAQRKFPRGNIPTDAAGGNIHIETSSIP